jgi:hypothetical protein
MKRTMTDAHLIEWGLHPDAIKKEFLNLNGFSETFPQRFIDKVIKSEPDSCWIIPQNTGPKKYAAIGRGFETSGSIGAHIASYILHNGIIPAGRDVCHSCDNTRCVNPNHLWLGTRKENMLDSKRKGRISTEFTISRKSRGESHARAIFTDEQVLEIIEQRKRGVPYYAIAADMKASNSAIAFICQGRTWSHITGIRR